LEVGGAKAEGGLEMLTVKRAVLKRKGLYI